MAKFRIVQVGEDNNECKYFKIQRKWLFFWFAVWGYTTGHGDVNNIKRPLEFAEFSDARDRLDDILRAKRKIPENVVVEECEKGV